MNKIRRILALVLNDIAECYPYLFGFYVISLLLAIIFKPVSNYFYWSGFTLFVLVFGALSLISEKGRRLFKHLPQNFTVAWVKSHISRTDYLKAILIALLFVFLAVEGSNGYTTLIILYTAASLLYGITSRISIGITLTLVIACSILLILEPNTSYAENASVYAYYFFIITMVLLVRDYLFGKRGD